jgi:hypothetical protein
LSANAAPSPDNIRRPRSAAPSPSLKGLRRIGPAPLAVPWTPANPWTDEYLARELASMGWLPDEFGIELADGQRRVLLERRLTRGLIEGYMRRDFLHWGPYPWLQIDGQTWMSITPMEIESHYMPIFLAEGRVGVGGLGLGYAALRMASKPDVAQVVVYENNPLMLHLWDRLARWANPSLLAKISVVDQDVATLEDQEFDLFYNDVYAKLLDPAAIRHWNTLTLANTIGSYHWWGFEAWLLPWVLVGAQHEIPFMYRHVYFPYWQQFLDAVEGGHGLWGVVGDLDQARAEAQHLHEGIWPL